MENKQNTGGHTQPQAATATAREESMCTTCKVKKSYLTIDGCRAAKAKLADWVWQGMAYMRDEIYEDAKLPDAQPRIDYLLDDIVAAGKLHFLLLGMSEEQAEHEAQLYADTCTRKSDYGNIK